MRLFFRSFTAVFLVACCAAGCKKDTPDNAVPSKAPASKLTLKMPAESPIAVSDTNLGVAVSVDGKTLAQTELKQQVETVMAAKAGQIPPAQQEAAKTYFARRIIQNFISKTLLLNETKRLNLVVDENDRKKYMETIDKMAKEQGMTTDEMIKKAPMGEKKAREEIAEGNLIEKLIDTQVRSKIKMDDAAVDAVIAKREQERTAKRTEIDAIRAQLLTGTNFEAIAREKSDCPSGKQSGGDLGTFGRKQMVAPFAEAAFTQKVGDIGPVVETSFGFHVIKVTAHNPAKPAVGNTPPSEETVQASHILLKAPPATDRKIVRKEMEDEQLGDAMKKFMEGLQDKAKIKTMFDQPEDVGGAKSLKPQ